MIGDLRIRIALYAAQDQADALGGSIRRWVFKRSLWAAIEPRSVTERSENGRLEVTQSYRVIIRYQGNFPERARLMWGARILRVITASDPDNRRERLHLICEEEQQ